VRSGPWEVSQIGDWFDLGAGNPPDAKRSMFSEGPTSI
jgi:hypothetical protein